MEIANNSVNIGDVVIKDKVNFIVTKVIGCRPNDIWVVDVVNSKIVEKAGNLHQVHKDLFVRFGTDGKLHDYNNNDYVAVCSNPL